MVGEARWRDALIRLLLIPTLDLIFGGCYRFFFILHGDVYKHALYTLGIPIFIHIKQMKAKLCKYISYGFNRKESMATSSINEMSSVGSRPAKPFPDQLQAR